MNFQDKNIRLYCSSLRGYLSQRILKQNGFESIEPFGGYKLWKACEAETSKLLSLATA
jgi:hypothetical protein